MPNSVSLEVNKKAFKVGMRNRRPIGCNQESRWKGPHQVRRSWWNLWILCKCSVSGLPDSMLPPAAVAAP